MTRLVALVGVCLVCLVAPAAAQPTVWVGVSASEGLGYEPVGVIAGGSYQHDYLELRASVDLAPKQDTGKGWNTGADVLVHGGQLVAGAGLRVWSGGTWTKTSGRLLAGWQPRPGIRLLVESTLEQGLWGGWSRSGTLEVWTGRVRLAVSTVRFTQADDRTGVSASLVYAVWKRQ
jgi:hypothetical protein